METIVHNIRDLSGNDRSAAEQLVGHALGENHQVIIQVQTVSAPIPAASLPIGSAPATSNKLPDYCNVYDGLSEAEVAQLEALILDRSPSRTQP